MKILFIDSTHPILISLLEAQGHECVAGHQLSREEILDVLPEYDGVVIRSRIQADREFFDHAPRLKFIGRVGAGMESIDIPYAESKGVACLNSPEGSRDAVAEHALGMLLALFRNIVRADKEVKDGKWIREANRGVELAGKTVSIIGYGSMGSAFARNLSGFGCKVLCYDKYKQDYSDDYVKETNMEEIFRETDILSLHVPLTPETTYFVDDAYLKRFQKNIYLVNTARGKCLRTDDLTKNLRSGKVLGACLDVLEYEESSFEKVGDLSLHLKELLEFSDRVILSPHIAAWTKESSEKLARVLAEKIISRFDGGQ